MDVMIRVIGQMLLLNSNVIRIVSGSKNFVKFIFSFSSDWELLTKYVQLVQGDSSYIIEIGNNKICYLPEEIVNGEFTLSLYGIGGVDGSIVATTNSLTFNVIKSNYIEDGSEEIIENSIATVEEVQAYMMGT